MKLKNSSFEFQSGKISDMFDQAQRCLPGGVSVLVEVVEIERHCLGLGIIL